MSEKDLNLPVLGHLDEVRKRLFVVIIAFIVSSSVSFYFIEAILRWLKMPGEDCLGVLTVFSPTAAILSFFKVSFFFGFIFTLPVLLYQGWMFIRPAVEEASAWWGALLISSGTGLFVIGSLLSFYFLVPVSLKFLMSIGKGELQFLISLDSYISFVMLFMLAGGLIFEIPLVAFFLGKLNLITAQSMLHQWKMAVVGSVIVSAFITPTPDAFNMVLMTLPILALYLLSIGIVAVTQSKRK